MLFSGCFSLKFMMKRAIVVKKIEKLEIAIAGFVVKWNMDITIGIATPPPPIPATLLRAMIKVNTNSPPYSSPCIGNTFLCEQMPGTLTPHMYHG